MIKMLEVFFLACNTLFMMYVELKQFFVHAEPQNRLIGMKNKLKDLWSSDQC